MPSALKERVGMTVDRMKDWMPSEVDAQFLSIVLKSPHYSAVEKELAKRLIASEARLAEAEGLLRKSLQLASIGYSIGEADMRSHDKVGERYGKQQDAIESGIKQFLSPTATR